jgi:hypothetical protein
MGKIVRQIPRTANFGDFEKLAKLRRKKCLKNLAKTKKNCRLKAYFFEFLFFKQFSGQKLFKQRKVGV